MAKSKTAQEEFEEIRKILKKGCGKYNPAYVSRQLHDKSNLRKVFLAIINHSPARISEVCEYSLLTKPTCYSQIFNLINLNLVDRIFVLPVVNGTVKHDEIKSKFIDWTKNMPESLKRYYLAKTSYWVITDFGKQFCMKAYNFEQEFKIEEEVKDEL